MYHLFLIHYSLHQIYHNQRQKLCFNHNLSEWVARSRPIRPLCLHKTGEWGNSVPFRAAAQRFLADNARPGMRDQRSHLVGSTLWSKSKDHTGDKWSHCWWPMPKKPKIKDQRLKLNDQTHFPKVVGLPSRGIPLLTTSLVPSGQTFTLQTGALPIQAQVWERSKIKDQSGRSKINLIRINGLLAAQRLVAVLAAPEKLRDQQLEIKDQRTKINEGRGTYSPKFLKMLSAGAEATHEDRVICEENNQ